MLSISLGIGAIALIVAAVEGANDKAYRIFDVLAQMQYWLLAEEVPPGYVTKLKPLT